MRKAAKRGVWLGLLVATPLPVSAQSTPSDLSAILNDARADDVARVRAACASGTEPGILDKMRAAGRADLPSVGAWCVTVLTRAGRDGALGYVRDASNATPTAAIAFDSGFVAGYLGGQPVPAAAPTMAALLPVADRCFDQAEPNLRLCTAAGRVIGARAAAGETVLKN